MDNPFNASYWEDNYSNSTTGWDIGRVSTPIKEYIEQLKDKTVAILIPGCGNGYEAEFLYRQSFKDIYILDIAKQPLDSFANRVPSFPREHLIHTDFFKHSGQYNIIIEQTFFCALDPALRKTYVEKMYQLLKNKGKLVGLLFDYPLTEKGPPFGGCTKEYLDTFSQLFHVRTLETSYNSVNSRVGKELFIIFEKK